MTQCVDRCEFLQLEDKTNKLMCRYHNENLYLQNQAIQRCKQCERHMNYTMVVNEFSDFVEEYNDYVSVMDEKIDNITILLDILKEKL